jgi:thiamine monophosphate kinase
VLATLPLVLSGVVLVSGALEQGAYGANPGQGVIYGLATGLAYTGFILVLRAGAATSSGSPAAVRRHLRRRGRVDRGRSVIGDADLVPSWPPTRGCSSWPSARRSSGGC